MTTRATAHHGPAKNYERKHSGYQNKMYVSAHCALCSSTRAFEKCEKGGSSKTINGVNFQVGCGSLATRCASLDLHVRVN